VGGKPLPLPVWDRDAGKLFNEFMDDHPATYDSRPRRSLTQWLEIAPPVRLDDRRPTRGSRWSVREIEPFISKHPDRHVGIQSRSNSRSFFRRVFSIVSFLPGARKFPGAAG